MLTRAAQERESIAASKLGGNLAHQLSIFVAWWNYRRMRRNQDKECPAYYAGILPREARITELFGWRHDFGPGRMPLIDAA